MKLILTYSLFFILLLLVSCNKGGLEYQLEGTVSDASFNYVPLSGCNVQLFIYPPGTTVGELVDQQTTDNSGRFEFVFPRERVVKYELIIRKENYFTSLSTLKLDDLTTENENVYDIDLNAVSWVKITLKNSSSPSPSDELKILKQNFFTACNDCCDNSYSFYMGMMDTIITCPTQSNDYVIIHHWLNGNEKYGYDSLVTVPLDTTYLDIVY